jgi:large subunit ribosomal protein L3
MKGLLARKIGMTHIISPETSEMVPVTLLQVPQNTVLQVKTKETDGYSGYVLGAFERNQKLKNVGKKYKYIKEVLADNPEYQKGDVLTVESLKDIATVKVTGISKGRGFSGVIKRHNFQRGRETHGSHHHREPGSAGMCAKPGRILKGKKFPGQYGAEQITVRSTKVVEIDTTNNLIAVKGAVPGAKNSFVSLIEA